MKATILMLMLATAGLAEVTAKVPFPFEAAGVKLPEGKYSLRPVHSTQETSWVLRNVETQRSVMMLRQATDEGRTQQQGAMRFRCTEAGRCALVEFWQPGQARNVLNTPKWATEAPSAVTVALGR